MRWMLALGGLLAAVMVRAEAPLDLDSPFLKTALITGKEGGYEERVIRAAKPAGVNLEMELQAGGIALIPKADVAAILPRLPEATMDFGIGDLQKAISFLESLPAPLRERPEASPGVLEKWRGYLPVAAEKETQRAEQKKKEEAELGKSGAAKVAGWVADWSDFRKSRTAEEIRDLRTRGEALRKAAPSEEATVEEGLAFLAQWQARPGASPLPDLEKLEGVAGAMEPEDLLAWTGAGILVASFFGLLIGLSFVSSGLTRFKDGAWLGGLVFLPIGLAVLGALGAVWWPVAGAGKEVEPALSPALERLVFAAKNSAQPVFFFPSVSVEAECGETAAGMLAAVSPAEEPTGFLKARFRESTCWLDDGGWTYRQTLTVGGLPFPLSLTFAGGPPSLGEWRQPAARKFWLGSIPLPVGLGEMFFQSVLASWGQGAEKAGLGKMRMEEGSAGKIRLSLAASGKRPELKMEVASQAIYRREISAEDLARAFADGHGKEFAGKFVLLDGVVEKVESGSELSGGTTASDAALLSGRSHEMGSRQNFDVFFLRGLGSHGIRKDPLEIRCMIKSGKVFVMDSRGDLYEGPHANTTQAEPIVKKGQRVKFLQEGRIESAEIKNNVVEVYGIRLDDPNQDIQVYDPTQPPQN